MTRVIAGHAGGRRLAVPKGERTRPTSERTREGLFSTLESLVGSWAGTAVLDLYAGAGTVGLEALSRGAARVLFVERDARTLSVLRDNLRALALPGAMVRAERVERLAAEPADRAYDVVFADPPYRTVSADLAVVLESLRTGGWLASTGVVVVERASRHVWEWPGDFVGLRSRRYGDSTLWYGRPVS